MGKVVPLLGVVVVGVLAWLLMSKPGGDAPAPAPAPASVASAAKVATPEVPEEAPISRPTRVVGALAVPRAPSPALGSVAAAEGAQPDEAAEPEAYPVKVMPVAPLEDVKNSVRAYYGNLPKSGAMPAKVTLDEVLPTEIIEALGARADAPLVMLGHRAITEREAYTEVLEMTSDYQQVLGVSWREPDGTEQRHYVQLTVPAKPQP